MPAAECPKDQAVKWTTDTRASSHLDGTPVTVRPVQQTDLELVLEMHQRLSKESTYFRYLAARQPTARDLRRLCSLGGETGAAIVATAKEPGEKVIAMACYGVDPEDSAAAEPAILVEDSYQGRGLGRQMLLALYQEATQNGVEIFEFCVHPANQRLLGLVDSCGLRYESRYVDGLTEIRVWLEPDSRTI